MWVSRRHIGNSERSEGSQVHCTAITHNAVIRAVFVWAVHSLLVSWCFWPCCCSKVPHPLPWYIEGWLSFYCQYISHLIFQYPLTSMLGLLSVHWVANLLIWDHKCVTQSVTHPVLKPLPWEHVCHIDTALHKTIRDFKEKTLSSFQITASFSLGFLSQSFLKGGAAEAKRRLIHLITFIVFTFNLPSSVARAAVD